MSIEADELPVTSTEWCQACDERRPLTDLLEITNVRTGVTFHVCRPGGLAGGGLCFRHSVGPSATHRIERTP